eukprot:Gb_34701 [translate_table: standard]
MHSARVFFNGEVLFLLIDGGPCFPLALYGPRNDAKSGLGLPGYERKMELYPKGIRLWHIVPISLDLGSHDLPWQWNYGYKVVVLELLALLDGSTSHSVESWGGSDGDGFSLVEPLEYVYVQTERHLLLMAPLCAALFSSSSMVAGQLWHFGILLPTWFLSYVSLEVGTLRGDHGQICSLWNALPLGSDTRHDFSKDIDSGNKVQELDAGALFVLESKGTWLHAGYHLTASIVAPQLLSLPFAFASLGWAAGIICLIAGAAVTFYSYNLLSLVLDHHEQEGTRHLRFKDVANDIMGPKWGRFLIGPIQFGVCYGAVISCILLGGQSMKFIYRIYHPDGPMKLYEFIICFGSLMLILAQMPSFHSLRHINMISLFLCFAFSACGVGGSIYAGHSKHAPAKDYSLLGSRTSKLFGVFNSISIIAFTYGNGILPEIQAWLSHHLNLYFQFEVKGLMKKVLQATLAPPVTGKMFKGLRVCYAVVLSTYCSVAISGYWAFGNKAAGTVYSNFIPPGQPALLPNWFLLMSNIFVILEISAVGLVYLQPTFEVLERNSADVKRGRFSLRNVVPRLILRSLSVTMATLVAAMLPFFGDINAVIGAFGFIPLDFVLPMLFYNLTFKPSKRSLIFWLNISIVVIFTIVGVLACVASIRQISLDAHTYKLFANV